MMIENRTSVIVHHQDSTTVVRCYEANTLIKTIDVTTHSYEYAEDTAENWIQGIIP